MNTLFNRGTKLTSVHQEVNFSIQEKIIWDKAILKFQSEEMNPPTMREMAKDLRISELILKVVFKKAIQQQLLVWVSNDIYYLFSTMKQMALVLQDMFDKQQQITVVEFRNRMKLGRNRIVLLIEAFDKIGFTLRIVNKDPKTGEVKDFRVIKDKKVFF